MASFNLTAELNLREPSNLNQVVSNIRRQLSTVSLNLNINPASSRGVQNITSQVQALSAAIQTANTNVAALSASLAGLGSTLSNVNGNIGSLGGGLSNISNQVNNVRNNTQQAAVGMEEFGRQSALAVRRFAAFSVATGGIYALVRAISEGYREFLSFNQELVKLQQVTGASANGLKGLASEITRLASSLGVSSSELLTVSSTLAQAGLTATQTKTALEALAKSALAPSFDNLNDTVEGSIALMRQFGISAGELEGSLGSINAVAAAFAVESGDIIKAIQRTGGVFAAASRGISEGKDSLNEFIALFTSVRATTRESAETIATGLRTIFTRIQRGGTIEALKEYGVELTDLEGKFVGPFEAIKRLSAGLQSLDPRDLRFSEIVEELGGFRQIGKVIPLIQQFATAQQALGVAQRGSGSLADDAATAQLALANKITKVREEFLALIRDIGESKSFQKFADLSLQLASALISVASAAKEVLPALTALAAIKAIPAVSQFIGGFGRGISRRNSGGPIRHFAGGGYVPGSGNRDTVPAMLTPGEFVIRKKAVETIGVGRLARLNRNGGGPVPTQYLNSGGVVQKFATGKYVKAKISEIKSAAGGSRISVNKLMQPTDSAGSRISYEEIDLREQDFTRMFKNIITEKIKTKKLLNKYSDNKAKSAIRFARGVGEFSSDPSDSDNPSKGLAFERYIKQKYPKLKTRGGRSGLSSLLFSPLDFDQGDAKFASASTIAYLKQPKGQLDILSKRLRFENKGNNLKWTEKTPESRQLQPTKVFIPPVGIKEKFDIWYKNETNRQLDTLNAQVNKSIIPQKAKKNLGGPIQKFMAGQFVKPAKKPKTVSPADLFVGPGGIESSVWSRLTKEALSTKQLKLGATGRTIVFPDGQEIDFKKALDANPNVNVRTALANAGIQPGELRKTFTDLYTAQRAGVVAATGNRSPSQIAGARSQNLLFGIAGMFGRRFSPKPLNLTTADGLKQNTSTVVFGSVLDQDNIEKQARLASRKQRLEAINARRSDRGKQPLQDTTLIDRMVAPTAKELSGSFQKGAAATIARQNKKLAMDSVSAIASTLSPSTGGSKIFLDFDRTLSFGSDKIGPKINKKKPDYSAFGIPSEVSAGLKNAKLSNLGSKLISIVGGLDSKSPGLGKELLRKMFVVSARPQNTMPLIARWLRNKGLRIPPSNVVGVGAPGLSPDAIAINKAEQMVKLGGGPGSVFIDDDPRNVSAARERGISSVRYGFKLDKKDPLARQQAATEEGYQFEKFVNDNLPPSLKRSFFKAEGEGIDFPAGLDPQIAKYWFNDSRLVGVPVDTKRTVGGPSTIKDNVISYLKDKGYASGGIVEKFSNGMEVDYVPGSAMAALKAVAREFITPKSRKGGKRKVSFLTQKAVSLSKNIPPELLKEIEKEGRLVSGTGIGDLPRGDMGLVVDKIVNVALARVKKRKAGQLKKTEGALTFSAAGLQRGPRAPAGQMEKTLAKYQQDPQYRAAMGLDTGVAGGFLKQFEALAKKKNFTSPKTFLDKLPGAKSQISEFRSSLQQQLKTATDPKEIKSLQDQIKKATTALDDFDSYMMGASPRNTGRASHFAWTMRQAVPDAARFAQGGSPQDTVPALLTPGEFVINKKAAQKIGSAKLNKLNKADKIKGFNKGGAVGGIQSFAAGGDVQRFFVGGIVDGFSKLTRAISSMLSAVTGFNRTTTTVTRNLAAQQAATFRQQGLSGPALKNAMVNAGYGPGGVNNMRTRNQMAQNATTRANQQQNAGQGGMGASALVWIGPLIAESINSAISSRFGQTGAMAGSTITSAISGATIGSALGPQGAIAGAVAGLAAGLLKLTDVARDYETAEKEKTIEAKAKILEKSFEKLAKETDKVKIAGLQESIIDNVRSVIGSERGVARNVTEAATPGSFSRFFGSTIDTTSLSKDLAQAGKTGGESAKAFIVDALSKGQDFDAVFKSLSKGSVAAQKQIQEAIAIAQEGTALTELRAKATEARESGNIPQANELMKQYDARVAEINQEFRKAAIEQQNAQKNLNAVTIAVNTFAVAIKNLDNVINRSSAEFAEAQRLMDIEIGGFFGEQAKIMGPSRLNENVLENPAAYSAQEITKAIQNLGQNLQFSPEFTKELETATQSKSILESELPNILAEAAAAQKAKRFDEASQENLLTKLEDLFKTVPGMGAGEAAGAAGNLFEEIKSKLSERQDISLEELSNNSAALNKILQGYNSTIDVAAKAQKSYNDVLNEVNGALNRYVSALEQTTDAQIQAATVRTEGRNRLAETLGQGVSLTSLNQPFEDMIRSLTSSIGVNGRPMAGTGTTDADTIARRLELSQKRFADLQKQNRPAAGTPAFDKYNKDLANAALSVRNLSKAQEKLATDTTKASNALNKIQELRQAQESRRGTFNDVLKNINNPEWIMNFTREVGALQKVQAGRGNLNDIPLALEALPKRLAGIADPGAREAEQQKFDDNIANILKNSGFDQGAVDQAMKLIGAQGPDNEMQAAIDQYNAAINNQAKAIENSANQTQTAANNFYGKIIQSANDFAARVGAAGVVPGGADPLASGGMVYASKGKLINFEPKGTDTVPAMLTPGEFVINRKATQKNLPLLKAINNGDKGYKNGGIVYAANGGEIGKRTLDGMTESFDSFKYYDSSGKKIPQSEFQRIAYRIDAGLIEITKRARETANIYDDNVIKDFGREISDLVLFGRSRSDEVAKMDPKKLYKFRVPFQRSFNTLKQKLINPSPPPQYLLDDILPPVAKPETIAKNPATQAKAEAIPAAIGGGGFRELPNLTSTPKYYDELTYKEWLDDLIGISWAKFDMGKYDQMTGPIPPDRKRFISPAVYYNKDAELTLDQKDKQQKAKQQIQSWEQEFNDWKTPILKRRQEFEIANIPYRPAKNEEYFDNFNKWIEYYTGKNSQEVEKIFATANYKPSFPARETLYDTRFTGGTVGDPRRKEDIPNNLPQNDILRIATGLKSEIDNSTKEYQAYLAQANAPNPNVELRDASLRIAEESYVDAITLLKEMSSKTNLFRNGLQIFETGTGKNLQIGAAINQLGQLRDKLRGGGALGRLQYNEVDDSIIDTYFANRAQIVEQNAPTVLKDPNKPELGTNLVDRPVTIKEVFDLSDEEKKSVRGIRGVSGQYQSALAYFKIKRGEYNRKLILAQRRMQYNQQKKQRAEQYKQGKIDRAEAAGLSNGGIVYASQGKLINFQPRGTDTVPAMLTPGEFIVNKKATKANMGLLKAINNSHNVKPLGFNKGGMVPTQYYADGDVASASSSRGGGVSSISVDASSLDAAFSNFNSYVSSLSSVIDGFTQGTTELAGLSQAISGLGNLGLREGASLMANAGISVKEATTAFSSAMTEFNTAASSLATAIGAIPQSISLTVSGSIPVTVSVQIEGGSGTGTDTAQLEQSIMDKVALAINSATQGGIVIDTAIA